MGRTLLAALLAALLLPCAARAEVDPDTLKRPSDQTDDAPAIQRAVDALCASTATRTIRLQARHYAIQSPIVIPCLVHVDGQGWQEQPIGQDLKGTSLSGTWLDVAAPAFGPNGTTTPITISGAAAAGSTFQGIALSQPVAMPNPGDKAWSPPQTPFLIAAENVNGGVAFRDILCRGVDKCLLAHVSGRTSFHNIRGQAWRILIRIDKSYDASHLTEIHAWPYYTTNPLVMAFQQANAVAILSERNDTPLFGRIFAFGTNVGIALANSGAEPNLPGGTTTGATIETLSCDFVRHCLYGTVDAPGIQLQAANIRSYAQDWNATPHQVAQRTGMLPGSDVVALLGPSPFAQIANLDSYGTNDTVIRLSNPAPGTVQIGSLHAILTRMSPGATLVDLTNAPHAIDLALPPALTPDPPPGWTLTNTRSPGTLAWPTITPRN